MTMAYFGALLMFCFVLAIIAASFALARQSPAGFARDVFSSHEPQTSLARCIFIVQELASLEELMQQVVDANMQHLLNEVDLGNPSYEKIRLLREIQALREDIETLKMRLERTTIDTPTVVTRLDKEFIEKAYSQVAQLRLKMQESARHDEKKA
jgi:hypothetical protein